MRNRLARLAGVLGLALLLASCLPKTASACDGADCSPAPVPTLAGPATNPAPPPAADSRLIDQAGVLAPDQATAIAGRLAKAWTDDNIDILVGLRVAPDRDTVEETQQDAQNIGNNAHIGVGARGGLVILFNLDDSKCHGQVQLYADDHLRTVASNDDRQAIFDSLMKPKLKGCDIAAAITIGIDTTLAVVHGDRSALPVPIDWGFWIVAIILVLLGLFVLALIIGRFAAYPDARRRYRDMMDRYQEGVDDPDTDTSDDDGFIYGGGHHRRRRRLRHVWSNPDWDDAASYPIYYGRPPGFWGWWFGVGGHTGKTVGGSASGGDWATSRGSGSSSGGSWGGSSSGGSWGQAGLAAGGFWSGIGHDAGSVLGGVGDVLGGLAEGAGSGGGGGFSGGGGAGGGF